MGAPNPGHLLERAERALAASRDEIERIRGEVHTAYNLIPPNLRGGKRDNSIGGFKKTRGHNKSRSGRSRKHKRKTLRRKGYSG